MTSVQKRMEPRRSLLGASVDQTDARSVNECVRVGRWAGGRKARVGRLQPRPESDRVDLDSFPPLGPARCVASVAAQVGMEEGRVGRKLQVEVGRGVDGQLAARQDQVEHVAAVRKWKWTPARSGSRRNPASGSPPACPHVLQMEDRLGLRHLG